MRIMMLFVVLLLVVGCGGAEQTNERPADQWYFITVPVPDGRPVVCVTNDLEDGISCDWDHR